MDTAFKTLAVFMEDWIDVRRKEIMAGGEGNDRQDILSLMIRASVEEGKYTMEKEALVSRLHLLLEQSYPDHRQLDRKYVSVALRRAWCA